MSISDGVIAILVKPRGLRMLKWASTTGGAENMKLEKERVLEYFTDQSRKMMAENLDDFIENIEKYIGPDPQ